MPKDTYFNLAEDKRKRVIDAAIEEFSTHSYHKARITAIAENAGIAKGSFYQYFKDKKDLFKHIIDLTVDKKLEYINQDMMKNIKNHGFFQLLQETYLSGVRFAKDNPRLLAIGVKLTNNKDLQREVWGDQQDKTLSFYKQLLEVGITKGELESDIDIELVSRLLSGLNYSLIDIVYKDGKIDLDGLVNEKGIVDKMISFIENGIKKNNNE